MCSATRANERTIGVEKNLSGTGRHMASTYRKFTYEEVMLEALEAERVLRQSTTQADTKMVVNCYLSCLSPQRFEEARAHRSGKGTALDVNQDSVTLAGNLAYCGQRDSISFHWRALRTNPTPLAQRGTFDRIAEVSANESQKGFPLLNRDLHSQPCNMTHPLASSHANPQCVCVFAAGKKRVRTWRTVGGH